VEWPRRTSSFARAQQGARVLEVGCGTGVVALTAAARAGAHASGVDLARRLATGAVGRYFEDNILRQDFLMTRAIKA
jgi:cyclopropane fatty-acyl-phospholipid synthase-like methyltransferase